MNLAPAIVLALVELHGTAGQLVLVNPAEVASVREPRSEGHIARGSRCVLIMANGGVIAVREDCAAVRRTLEGR